MLKCPNCGQSDRFSVDGSCAIVIDENEEIIQLHSGEWDRNRMMTCTGCGHFDRFWKFELDDEEEEKESKG